MVGRLRVGLLASILARVFTVESVTSACHRRRAVRRGQWSVGRAAYLPAQLLWDAHK